MKLSILRSVLAVLCLLQEGLLVQAFSPAHPQQVAIKRSPQQTLYMSTVEDSVVETTEKGLLKRDRYVATNRFAVRKDKQAKFEKRWATRKSRLATLPGFKYFHLMRRVNLKPNGVCEYDGGETEEEAQENYVSFTIWNKKSDFSAWRSGEAFKEAHGGTSIGAFLTTMVSSAMVLRGPPRPAFYDGLLLDAKKPDTVPQTIDGWRNVDADGVNTLPPECYIEMAKYKIPSGSAAADFEKSWANKASTAKDVSGFVARSLMRRDGQAKGHGVAAVEPTEPTYVLATIFEDRASFEAWAETREPQEASETEYYEGTLVIASADGA